MRKQNADAYRQSRNVMAGAGVLGIIVTVCAAT